MSKSVRSTGRMWTTAIFTVIGLAVLAQAQTWNCGAPTNEGGGGEASVTATLDANGTLTISGTGAMADYPSAVGNAPWHNSKNSITSVVIERGVTTIGINAFNGCSNLTSVTIPKSVVYTDRIDDGVRTIGASAFANCSKLTSVTIPNSVTTIGENAFEGCSMTSVTIPGSERYLGGTVLSGVTSIGDGAFKKSSLTEVTIGDNVESIGKYAFYGCKDLTSITVHGNNTVYSSVGGVLFNKYQTTLVLYPAGKQGAYSINTNVTKIGPLAFAGCTGLTSVSIPGSVTAIDWRGFYACTGLTSITSLAATPPNIESNEVFEDVTISNVYLYVQKSAIATYKAANIWKNFDIQEVTWQCGSPNLADVTATLDGGVLTVSGTGKMKDYPLDNYKNTAPWKIVDRENITGIVVKDGVTHIGDWAFGRLWYSVTSVTIGSTVETIGEGAFFQVGHLKSLTIPNSVTSIGNEAFVEIGLETVIIGSGVTTIGDFAFANSSNLSVSVPATPPTLGTDVFSWSGSVCLNIPPAAGNAYSTANRWKDIPACGAVSPTSWQCGSPNLADVTATLDNGVLTISGTGKMKDFTNFNDIPWWNSRQEVTDVIIENGVTYIGGGAGGNGEGAFTEFSSLTSVTIPNSVTSIGAGAFIAVPNLTSMTNLAATPPTMGASVFAGLPVTACLHVPSGSKALYEAAPQWTDFSCIQEIGSAVTTYTITFNLNYTGAATPTTSVTGTDGKLASLPANPSRSGYTFDGWYKEPGYTTLWDFDNDEVTESITLYAKWAVITYTVEFDSRGGSSVSSQTINHGEKAVKPTNPDKPDNNFGGWYKEAACKNSWNFNTDVVTSDVTLYAKWTAKSSGGGDDDEPETYTIKFDANGGTVSPASRKTNASGKVSLPTPEREGYTFDSWYTAKTGGKNVTGSTVFDDDATIYAQWTINTYKVTFSAGSNGAVTAEVGGKDIKTGDVVEYGKSVVFTAEPADGYKVSGWKLGSKTVSGNKTETYTIGEVKEAVTVTVSFAKTDAILTPDRVIPNAKPEEEAMVVAPVSQLSGEFTAGPNPVGRELSSVGFFRQGKRIASGELRIYDAVGNVVSKVKIVDKAIGTQARRQVGSWDLTDVKGKPVSEGTYLVKGVLKTSDGKKEKVSVILGVR